MRRSFCTPGSATAESRAAAAGTTTVPAASCLSPSAVCRAHSTLQQLEQSSVPASSTWPSSPTAGGTLGPSREQYPQTEEPSMHPRAGSRLGAHAASPPVGLPPPQTDSSPAHARSSLQPETGERSRRLTFMAVSEDARSSEVGQGKGVSQDVSLSGRSAGARKEDGVHRFIEPASQEERVRMRGQNLLSTPRSLAGGSLSGRGELKSEGDSAGESLEAPLLRDSESFLPPGSSPSGGSNTSSPWVSADTCQTLVAYPAALPPLVSPCLTSSDLASRPPVSSCLPASPAHGIPSESALCSSPHAEGALTAYPPESSLMVASSDCQRVGQITPSRPSSQTTNVRVSAPAINAETESVECNSLLQRGEEPAAVSLASFSDEDAGGNNACSFPAAGKLEAGKGVISALSEDLSGDLLHSSRFPSPADYMSQDVCADPASCSPTNSLTLPLSAPATDPSALPSACPHAAPSSVSSGVSATEGEGKRCSDPPQYRRTSSTASSTSDGVVHPPSSLSSLCSTGVGNEPQADLSSATGAREPSSAPEPKDFPPGRETGDDPHSRDVSSTLSSPNVNGSPSCSPVVADEAGSTVPSDSLGEGGASRSSLIFLSSSECFASTSDTPRAPSTGGASFDLPVSIVSVKGEDVEQEPSCSHASPLASPPSEDTLLPCARPSSEATPSAASAAPVSQVALRSAAESRTPRSDDGGAVGTGSSHLSCPAGPTTHTQTLSPVPVSVPHQASTLASVPACASAAGVSLHSSPALVAPRSPGFHAGGLESFSRAPASPRSAVAPCLPLPAAMPGASASSAPSSPARTASSPLASLAATDISRPTAFTAASPADLSPKSATLSPCRPLDERQDACLLSASPRSSSAPTGELQQFRAPVTRLPAPPSLSPNACVRCLQEYFLSTFPHRRLETASAAFVHKARVKCFAMLKAIKRHASSWASDELVPTAFHGVMTPYTYHVSRVFCCPPVDLNSYFHVFRRWLLKARFEKRPTEAVSPSPDTFGEQGGSIDAEQGPLSAEDGGVAESDSSSTEGDRHFGPRGGLFPDDLLLHGRPEAPSGTRCVSGSQSPILVVDPASSTKFGSTEASEDMAGVDMSHVEKQADLQPGSSDSVGSGSSPGFSPLDDENKFLSCPDTGQADAPCRLSRWLLSRLNEAELPSPVVLAKTAGRDQGEEVGFKVTPPSTERGVFSGRTKAISQTSSPGDSDKTPDHRTSRRPSSLKEVYYDTFGLDRVTGNTHEEDECSTSAVGTPLGFEERRTKSGYPDSSPDSVTRGMACEEQGNGGLDQWAFVPPAHSNTRKSGPQRRDDETGHGIFTGPTRLGDLSIEELRATIVRFVKKQAPRQSCPPSLQRVRRIHDALVAFLQKHDEANFPPLCPGVVSYDMFSPEKPNHQRRESLVLRPFCASSYPSSQSLDVLSLDPEAEQRDSVDVGTLRDFVRNSKLKQRLRVTKLSSERAGAPLTLEPHSSSCSSRQFLFGCEHSESRCPSGCAEPGPETRSPSGRKKKRTRLDLASLLEETDTTAESEGSLYSGAKDSDEVDREDKRQAERKRHEACVAIEPAWDRSVEELLDDLDELRNEAETSVYTSPPPGMMSCRGVCAVPCYPRKPLLLAPLFQAGSPPGSVVRLSLPERRPFSGVQHSASSRAVTGALSVSNPRHCRPSMTTASPSTSRCLPTSLGIPRCGVLSEADINRACGFDDRNAVFSFAAPARELEVSSVLPQQRHSVDSVAGDRTRSRSGHTFRRLPTSAPGGARRSPLGQPGTEMRTGRGPAVLLPSQQVDELLSGTAEPPPRKTRRVFFQRHETAVQSSRDLLRDTEVRTPPTGLRGDGEGPQSMSAQGAGPGAEALLRSGSTPCRAPAEAAERRAVQSELVGGTFSGSYTITTRHRRRVADTCQHPTAWPATSQRVARPVAPPRETAETPGSPVRKLSETRERVEAEKQWGSTASTAARGQPKKDKARVFQSEGCSPESSRSLSPGSLDGFRPRNARRKSGTPQRSSSPVYRNTLFC